MDSRYLTVSVNGEKYSKGSVGTRKFKCGERVSGPQVVVLMNEVLVPCTV